MTVNRTTLLDLPLPVTGTESGTWGDTTNNGLSQYMDIAIAGMNSLTSANFTAGALTIANTQGDSSATNIAAGSAQYATIRVSSLAVNSTITAPGSNRSYRIINADATYSLTIKASGQTGVTFLPGQTGVVAFNGTDYVIVGVVGAGTATDNAVARFDGTTGKLVQNSVVTIADSTGDISGVGQLNATTVDATNIEVTNIKAKDGTAAGSIADSTGVVSFTANPVMSGGTANGVLYLNGSKVATSGSALTFDGTTFQYTGAANFATSTGNVGIGVTSPATKLDVRAPAGSGGFITLVNTTAFANTNVIETSYTLNNSTSGLATAAVIGVTNPAATGNSYGDIYFKTTNPTSGLVERMRLDSSGNLGLGVTPSAGGLSGYRLFEISAGGASLYAGTNQLLIGSNVSWNGSTASYKTSHQASLYNQASGAHSWSTAPSGTAGNAITFTQAMTLDSSGNLGLGVTPSAWGSAPKAIEIGGTAGSAAYIAFNSTATSQGYNYWNMYYNGTNNIVKTTGTYPAYFGLNSSGQFVWGVSSSTQTAGATASTSQAMTLDASGNLGVGSTTPSNTAGYRYVSILDGSTGSALSFRKSTNAEYGSLFATASDNSINLYATLVGPLIFGTSGVERARITSGGDLLVGTTTDTGNKLAVYTSVGTAVAGVVTGSASQLPLACWNQITSGDNLFASFGTETAYTVRGTIDYNRAGGLTRYNTTSDYRAKDIIGPLQNVGATIDALKVYEGVMKGATQSRPMLVAHEAQEHAPYAVSGVKDEVNEDGTPKFQQMDVSSLVPLLLAEIQSLRQRVALLEGN